MQNKGNELDKEKPLLEKSRGFSSYGCLPASGGILRRRAD